MVEKIIVNPGKVRGLGNIVHPKMGDDFTEYMCTLEVTEDSVIGADTTVYVLEPEDVVINVALSSSAGSCTIGESIVLTATVLEDGEPVEGGEVSFKLGSTTLGTDETDANGVATYTYTASVGGSNNFTAYFEAHSSNTVSVVVSKLTTTTTLSLTKSSIIVGGSTVATATVKQNNTGIPGVTVTFKDGTTTLDTVATNSSGVAACTISGLSVGSHSITAVAGETETTSSSTSSAVTLTVLDHDYSIGFSQASYPATSGSATLEMTLLDNSVPVSGATVSVVGSDSSLYSGITDNSGVATVTVTVNTDTTFTASYQGVSDTCTVTTGPTVLFYDPCSPSYVSENYGTILKVSSSTTTNYTAYDSTNDCYKTRANGDWGVIPITALNGKDNYKIEAYFKRPNTNPISQGGFSFANPNNPSNSVFYVRMRGDGKVDYGNPTSATNIVGTDLGSGWIKIELTVQGQSIIAKVYDGDTLKGSANITNPISNSVIGLHLIGGSSYGFYVKEIKAVSL